MKKFRDEDLVTLKTAEEQVKAIDNEIELLRFEEAREKWLYDDRMREIRQKIKRLEEEKRVLHDEGPL